MKWTFKKFSNLPKLKEPILIEGLPGIGNVGKIAVDFIIEEIKPKKIYEIFSYDLPHSVFVKENNLVELPKITLYHKKIKNKDFLIMTGDTQPINENSCYEFCDELLDLLQKQKVKEIITVGGIGLHKVPKEPVVYCTGNSKEIIKKYKEGTSMNDKVYGVVGPIVGVSGVLLGLAGRRKIPAISLLAETYGHPLYLGIKGAKEIIKVLNKKTEIKVNIDNIEKEIKDLESSIIKAKTVISKGKNEKNIGNIGIDYIG